MSIANRSGAVYVPPLQTADGVQLVDAKGRGKYPLAASTTYVYPLGGANAPLQSVQIEWDAAAILTITVEDSNVGDADSLKWSTTAGEWIKEDPSTAYVALVGAGATVANATVSVAGGAAGGAMYNLGNTGAMRTRIRIVVGGTGGVVRVSAHGKT